MQVGATLVGPSCLCCQTSLPPRPGSSAVQGLKVPLSFHRTTPAQFLIQGMGAFSPSELVNFPRGLLPHLQGQGLLYRHLRPYSLWTLIHYSAHRYRSDQLPTPSSYPVRLLPFLLVYKASIETFFFSPNTSKKLAYPVALAFTLSINLQT